MKNARDQVIDLWLCGSACHGTSICHTGKVVTGITQLIQLTAVSSPCALFASAVKWRQQCPLSMVVVRNHWADKCKVLGIEPGLHIHLLSSLLFCYYCYVCWIIQWKENGIQKGFKFQFFLYYLQELEQATWPLCSGLPSEMRITLRGMFKALIKS